MFMPQFNWLCDERGRLLVDFLGKYETLNSDFQQLCELIGVTANLPRTKSTTGIDFRIAYDADSYKCIEQRFDIDLLALDYKSQAFSCN